MSKHDDCIRGFYILSEASYYRAIHRPDYVDEIMIGMYHSGGGTTGEFAVRWKNIGSKVTPRLEAFDDAWDALLQFKDLLEWMATVDGEDVSPQDFAAQLRSMGIADRTSRACDEKSPGDLEYLSWSGA